MRFISSLTLAALTVGLFSCHAAQVECESNGCELVGADADAFGLDDEQVYWTSAGSLWAAPRGDLSASRRLAASSKAFHIEARAKEVLWTTLESDGTSNRSDMAVHFYSPEKGEPTELLRRAAQPYDPYSFSESALDRGFVLSAERIYWLEKTQILSQRRSPEASVEVFLERAERGYPQPPPLLSQLAIDDGWLYWTERSDSSVDYNDLMRAELASGLVERVGPAGSNCVFDSGAVYWGQSESGTFKVLRAEKKGGAGHFAEVLSVPSLPVSRLSLSGGTFYWSRSDPWTYPKRAKVSLVRALPGEQPADHIIGLQEVGNLTATEEGVYFWDTHLVRAPP